MGDVEAKGTPPPVIYSKTRTFMVTRLKIIPVIDIKDGWVVHARRGQRAAYEPVRSPLSPDAQPSSVVEGLLRLADFDTLYIADLDALMGKAPQTAIINGIRAANPALNIWVDAGLAAFQGPHGAFSHPMVPVVGSESLLDETLSKLAVLNTPWILSLDYFEDRFIGPEQLLIRPCLWPEWIILMKLARVGSFKGPDLETTRQFVNQYPNHRFVVAGGVRHPADLDDLACMGVAAVLVASALHAGTLDSPTLASYVSHRGCE